jgi:tRNA pseudouridine13 synthase
MKLKQTPEDFQVEEVTDVVPGPHGHFAFYRMQKSGWATPDAFQAIRRRWRLSPSQLAYGGLKDRHALTSQHLTILDGPRRDLEHGQIYLHYLGQVTAPFSSACIAGNLFRITLRAAKAEAMPAVDEALREIEQFGVPNYFDDQRFGSVNTSGRFIGREMVLAHWEEALKIAIADPYAYDRGPAKEEKNILRQHWGDWPKCKSLLPRSHARSIVTYLADHPTDFRGAMSRMHEELQGLYLSAYQSHIWNRANAWRLRSLCSPDQLIEIQLRLGPAPFFRSLAPEMRAALQVEILPLPSARLKLAAESVWRPVFDAVLAEDGVTLETMKLRGLQKPFFSRGERPVLCLPRRLSWETSPDDRHSGRLKLALAFELPKGSYATLIVKRVQAAGGNEASSADAGSED